MSERRQKRTSEGFIEVNPEELGFVLEPTRVEIGSGYTLSVSYDINEKPIVGVKTYGKVDISQLVREIERLFPNAQIRHLNGTASAALVKRRKRRRMVEKK
jgi:hypothetical protein